MLSERIKTLRLEKGISQKELGKIADLGEKMVCEIEKGRSKTHIDNLVKIADYFNVSLDFLVGRTDNPDVNE